LSEELMDIVDAMWLAVAGYFVAQVYVLVRWRGGWRIAAAVPLLLMIPVFGVTTSGFAHQSNLWPISLLFAAPVALLYLLILMAIRRFTRTALENRISR